MIGLRYFSFWGPIGYAQAARRYLLGLKRLNFPVTWTPILGNPERADYIPFEGRSVGDPDLDSLCNKDIPYDVALFHTTPFYYPRLREMVRGKRVAAYTVWETQQLPADWLRLLDGIELVIVPCEWNRPTFEAGGFPGPVEVVPHPVAPGYDPSPLPVERPTPLVFYSINVWEDRKGLDRTLGAYLRAFTGNDPVHFVLKTTPRDLSRRVPFTKWRPFHTRWLVDQMRQKVKNPPEIVLHTEEMSDPQIRDLHHSGHCYVSLCHSEGWGLGAFDAASLGRPVIMTGYGGQTEFLSKDLSYLVDYRMARIPFRPLRTHDFGQRWADADIGHGSALMRDVFENWSDAAVKGSKLASNIAKNYALDVTAQQLLDTLGRHF